MGKHCKSASFDSREYWLNIASFKQRVTPPLVWHLKGTYPFNPAPTDIKSLSDAEYRNVYGEEAYTKLVVRRVKAKRKMGMGLSDEEEIIVKEHPELVETL